MAWPALRVVTAEDEAAWAASRAVQSGIDREIAACAGDGGHQWHLEISPDPDDGVSLGCSRCPANVDDIVMDGIDLLCGEFEVYPGYVLCLDGARVLVNGTDYDGLHLYGWRGPVTAVVRTERAGYFDGYEYDYYIDLAPA